MKLVMDAIQALLIANGKNNPESPLHDLKKVYFGDKFKKIPESSQPCIAIMPISTEIDKRGSRYDQKTHTIELRLIYNARTFFGKAEASDISNRVMQVEDIVQKVEKTVVGETQEVATNTIVGIIQSNPTLPLTINGVSTPTVAESSVTSVDYVGLSEARGFQTFEVVVTVEAISVGDRS